VRSVAQNLLHDPAVCGVVVNTEDVTDRRVAEERLRESEERYRLLFERNPLPMYVVERATRRFLAVNEAAVAAYGYSREEFLTRSVPDLEPPADRAAAEGLPAAGGRRVTRRHRRRDGSMLDAEVTADVVTFDGRPARLVAVQDVTDRMAAAAERERLTRQLGLERARLAACSSRRRPSSACCAARTTASSSRTGRTTRWWVRASSSAARWRTRSPSCASRGSSSCSTASARAACRSWAPGCRLLLRRAAGAAPDERFLDVVYQPIVEADGSVSGIFVHGVDVTERVRSERERERLLRRIEDDHVRLGEVLRQMPFGVIIAEAPSGRVIQGNDRVERVFGHPLLHSADTSEYREWVGYHADGRRVEAHEWPLARALAGGENPQGEEYRYPRPDEADAWIRLTAGPIRERGGRIVAAVVAAEDVTERRRAEQASDGQRELLQAVFDHIPAMIAVVDTEATPVLVNAEWTRVMGWTLETARQADLMAELFPDPSERKKARRLAVNATGVWTELRVRVRDGRTLDTLWAVVTLSDGSNVYIGQDVSDRERMAAQLRQAQKMEAVGQLAGGVAHDFNNLLTVISSYALMLVSELPPDDAMRADLNEIQAATERAAGLTGQLLAFSRQQVLDPRVIDLRQLVERMASMLGRLVREDVELTIACGDAPTHVRADPGQVEQVVMNLAVNARDAMPSGGQLRIDLGTTVVGKDGIAEHPFVAPGEYACVRVADTGTGMNAATVARIFDPFFTTKELGKGTGLGLATVYGIVKQSGGYVLVDSAVGAGTTFRILLPHLVEGAPSAVVEAPAAGAGRRRTRRCCSWRTTTPSA
jgi:PAS domain S-box-containing protein